MDNTDKTSPMEYREDNLNKVSYLRIRDIPVAKTVEVTSELVLADLDEEGLLVGIEILDTTQDFPEDEFFAEFNRLTPEQKVEILSYLS